MILAAKSSLRYYRRLGAYASTLPNSFQASTVGVGAPGGRVQNTGNGHQTNENFRRRLSTTASSNVTQEQDPTATQRSGKNIIQQFYEKYSMSKQTNRILMAESLFQAATTQASDP